MIAILFGSEATRNGDGNSFMAADERGSHYCPIEIYRRPVALL